MAQYTVKRVCVLWHVKAVKRDDTLCMNNLFAHKNSVKHGALYMKHNYNLWLRLSLLGH